jgi:DNA-binding transcriptional LysR family regulator
MDSIRLKYFISAAQCLNFSEVARNNYISQPTISHQIGLLEQELGVGLFFREGKKLYLTNEGKYFLPMAIKILNDIQDVSLDMIRYKQGQKGKVSILVAETCRVAYQLCIAEFSRLYPGVLVETEIVFSPVQVSRILSGGYDACFVAESFVKNNECLDYLVTNQDRLCLVLPENIPDPEDLNDFSFLEGIPFIGLSTYEPSYVQDSIRQAFQKRNYTPQLINRYNRMEEALLSVEANVGFSLLPYSITSFNLSKRIKYFPLEDESLVNCVAAWQRCSQNCSAELFIDVLKSIFSKSGT